MNLQGISDYEDYLNELRHEYCISTGERQVELRKILYKEIAEKYEHDHPRPGIEDMSEESGIPGKFTFNESKYLDQAHEASFRDSRNYI